MGTRRPLTFIMRSIPRYTTFSPLYLSLQSALLTSLFCFRPRQATHRTASASRALGQRDCQCFPISWKVSFKPSNRMIYNCFSLKTGHHQLWKDLLIPGLKHQFLYLKCLMVLVHGYHCSGGVRAKPYLGRGCDSTGGRGLGLAGSSSLPVQNLLFCSSLSPWVALSSTSHPGLGVVPASIPLTPY